jgi:hypothetical protein
MATKNFTRIDFDTLDATEGTYRVDVDNIKPTEKEAVTVFLFGDATDFDLRIYSRPANDSELTEILGFPIQYTGVGNIIDEWTGLDLRSAEHPFSVAQYRVRTDNMVDSIRVEVQDNRSSGSYQKLDGAVFY